MEGEKKTDYHEVNDPRLLAKLTVEKVPNRMQTDPGK